MKYIGNGKYLPGIPARDLTVDEVKQFTKKALLASGLYEEIKPAKKKAAKDE